MFKMQLFLDVFDSAGKHVGQICENKYAKPIYIKMSFVPRVGDVLHLGEWGRKAEVTAIICTPSGQSGDEHLSIEAKYTMDQPVPEVRPATLDQLVEELQDEYC